MRIAATQMACSWDLEDNLQRAESLVRQAAGAGAQVIVLQELFETPYFCQEQLQKYYELARPVENHPVLTRFSEVAAELGVVLPISFFERAGTAYFNSLAMIDADGTIMGVYRKSHIPDGPGYQEKFYFSPGDTGFKVFETKHGNVGALVCWDQWFPEAARCAVLQGADVLVYPTAIGSEPPPAPPTSSYAHWARVMQGHAASNMVPVVASNRIGRETFGDTHIDFYGGSFIADPTGVIVEQVGGTRNSGHPHPKPEPVEGFVVAEFDLKKCRANRAGWGLFRDRRPDLYGAIATLDGRFDERKK